MCFRRVTVLCAQDAFIRLRTGAMTMHTLPFANSDLSNSARDGQFYRLRYLLGFFLVDEVNRDCRWALLGIRAAEMRAKAQCMLDTSYENMSPQNLVNLRH